MDVDQPTQVAPIDIISESSPLDAFILDVGGFPSPSTIIHTFGMKQVKNRMAFDFIEPSVSIQNDRVYVGNQPLFELHKTPLIAQFIFLKPFLCPENFQFFIEWIKYIHSMASDQETRAMLFGPSYESELWFKQSLPVINMENPLSGLLQTLQYAKIGK